MSIIINDEDRCVCGAYWQGNGYCCNMPGHPRWIGRLCKCGGRYEEGKDVWASRMRCNKCGDYFDLSGDKKSMKEIKNNRKGENMEPKTEEEMYTAGYKAGVAKKKAEEKQKEKDELAKKEEAEKKKLDAAYEKGYTEGYGKPREKPTTIRGDPTVEFPD